MLILLKETTAPLDGGRLHNQGHYVEYQVMLLDVILHTSLITCKALFGTVAAVFPICFFTLTIIILMVLPITIGKPCKHVCMKLSC